MATRWVVVDDTSADINYVGDSWFADVGSQDSAGNYGSPFLSTLHGTNTSANFTFNFSGSSVRVMGANNIRNDSGVIDPQWSCFVDGTNIDSGSPFQYPENNWHFCSAYNLTDGLHTITVNATVARNQTFWFDRIEYVPSKSVSLRNKTIMLTSVDPAIQYGPGWSSYANIGNWTQRQGGLFALNFYGSSLSWYGHIPSEWNGNSTTAKWVIDDRAAQVLILRGHGTGAVTAYNQKFFETPVYSLGPHTFTVTYNGDTAKTPLVLGSLVIQNGTASGSISGSASTAQATDTTTSETPAIVGGVVGGVVCLLIVIFLVLYRRRRQSNKERREDVDYIPASQVIPYAPPSRLPAKMLEASNTSFPGHSPRPSDPSSIYTPESTTYLFGSTIADGQHSRNPSGSSHIAVDSIGGAASTSTFVVHQDSGARLPQVTPRPLVDIPPAYTPE